MERTLTIFGLGTAALLGMLLTLAVQGIPETSVGWIDEHQGLAAWVQGVGTIVAVAVAAWAGSLPVRHAEKLRAEARVDQLNAIEFVAQRAFALAYNLRDGLNARDEVTIHLGVRNFRRHGSLEMLEKLTGVDLDRWPTMMMYSRAAAMEAAAREILVWEPEEIIATADEWSALGSCRNDLVLQYERLLEEIDKCRSELRN